MKHIAQLFACFLLTCCGATQFAWTDKNNQTHGAQFGGIASKANGTVQRIKKGDFIMEQVQDMPDSTEVPKQLSSDHLTLGLGREYGKTQRNNDSIKGANEGKQIDAKHAENMADKTVPNPNDGKVEEPPEVKP